MEIIIYESDEIELKEYPITYDRFGCPKLDKSPKLKVATNGNIKIDFGNAVWIIHQDLNNNISLKIGDQCLKQEN